MVEIKTAKNMHPHPVGPGYWEIRGAYDYAFIPFHKQSFKQYTQIMRVFAKLNYKNVYDDRYNEDADNLCEVSAVLDQVPIFASDILYNGKETNYRIPLRVAFPENSLYNPTSKKVVVGIPEGLDASETLYNYLEQLSNITKREIITIVNPNLRVEDIKVKELDEDIPLEVSRF